MPHLSVRMWTLLFSVTMGMFLGCDTTSTPPTPAPPAPQGLTLGAKPPATWTIDLGDVDPGFATTKTVKVLNPGPSPRRPESLPNHQGCARHGGIGEVGLSTAAAGPQRRKRPPSRNVDGRLSGTATRGLQGCRGSCGPSVRYTDSRGDLAPLGPTPGITALFSIGVRLLGVSPHGDRNRIAGEQGMHTISQTTR